MDAALAQLRALDPRVRIGAAAVAVLLVVGGIFAVVSPKAEPAPAAVATPTVEPSATPARVRSTPAGTAAEPHARAGPVAPRGVHRRRVRQANRERLRRHRPCRVRSVQPQDRRAGPLLRRHRGSWNEHSAARVRLLLRDSWSRNGLAPDDPTRLEHLQCGPEADLDRLTLNRR